MQTKEKLESIKNQIQCKSPINENANACCEGCYTPPCCCNPPPCCCPPQLCCPPQPCCNPQPCCDLQSCCCTPPCCYNPCCASQSCSSQSTDQSSTCCYPCCTPMPCSCPEPNTYIPSGCCCEPFCPFGSTQPCEPTVDGPVEAVKHPLLSKGSWETPICCPPVVCPCYHPKCNPFCEPCLPPLDETRCDSCSIPVCGTVFNPLVCDPCCYLLPMHPPNPSYKTCNKKPPKPPTPEIKLKRKKKPPPCVLCPCFYPVHFPCPVCSPYDMPCCPEGLVIKPYPCKLPFTHARKPDILKFNCDVKNSIINEMLGIEDPILKKKREREKREKEWLERQKAPGLPKEALKNSIVQRSLTQAVAARNSIAQSKRSSRDANVSSVKTEDNTGNNSNFTENSTVICSKSSGKSAFNVLNSLEEQDDTPETNHGNNNNNNNDENSQPQTTPVIDRNNIANSNAPVIDSNNITNSNAMPAPVCYNPYFIPRYPMFPPHFPMQMHNPMYYQQPQYPLQHMQCPHQFPMNQPSQQFYPLDSQPVYLNPNTYYSSCCNPVGAASVNSNNSELTINSSGCSLENVNTNAPMGILSKGAKSENQSFGQSANQSTEQSTNQSLGQSAKPSFDTETEEVDESDKVSKQEEGSRNCAEYRVEEAERPWFNEKKHATAYNPPNIGLLEHPEELDLPEEEEDMCSPCVSCHPVYKWANYRQRELSFYQKTNKFCCGSKVCNNVGRFDKPMRNSICFTADIMHVSQCGCEPSNAEPYEAAC